MEYTHEHTVIENGKERRSRCYEPTETCQRNKATPEELGAWLSCLNGPGIFELEWLRGYRAAKEETTCVFAEEEPPPVKMGLAEVLNESYWIGVEIAVAKNKKDDEQVHLLEMKWTELMVDSSFDFRPSARRARNRGETMQGIDYQKTLQDIAEEYEARKSDE